RQRLRVAQPAAVGDFQREAQARVVARIQPFDGRIVDHELVRPAPADHLQRAVGAGFGAVVGTGQVRPGHAGVDRVRGAVAHVTGDRAQRAAHVGEVVFGQRVVVGVAATPRAYTLSLLDALPIYRQRLRVAQPAAVGDFQREAQARVVARIQPFDGRI